MKVEIPLDGVKATMEGTTLRVEGPNGVVSRTLFHPFAQVNVEGDKVVLQTQKDRKKDKRMINTFSAHIRNMIHGAKKNFRYEMEIVQSHFPMQVKIQGQELLIDNFLGEKVPRKTKIPEGVKVTVNTKDKQVIVESNNIELAGMAVTRIEQVCRVRNKDRRIFQDGIYLVRRPKEVEE